MSFLITRQMVRIAAVAAIGTTVLATEMPRSALSQAAVDLIVVDMTTVGKGYRASKLLSSSVVNDHNEKIGTVDDIIIGPENVLFAVLQVGGFLGLGGHLVAVPYTSLVLDHPGGKVELPGASKDALKKLPEFKYT
jgi:sporulation protein YlmC with PRC-barrel domain